MLQNAIVSFLFVLISGVFALVFGQATTAVKPVVLVGDVVSITDGTFVVNAKAGPVEIVTNDKTSFKRVSAETLSLTGAVDGSIGEISVGDGLTVSALTGEDGKTLTARSVYYVTKADTAAKSAKDLEKWQKRGVKGRVVSVNTQTNQMVIEISGLTGTTKMTLTPKEDAKFLRYAQDSVRYDQAEPSSLAAVKVDDMLRALGDKSIDGTSFSAEEIVAGAFQTVAGTVKSVNVDTNEVVITNLQTKKDITIVISGTSILKKFPAEQAEGLARMQMMGAGGARPVGQGGFQGRGGGAPGGQRGGGAPGGAPAAGTQAGAGAPGGARIGGPGAAPTGVDDMMDRLPAITAADLKAGDMIAISSTKNGVHDKIKAIKLLAGVEPFLRLAQVSNAARRGGGVDGGFSIPGLDP